VTRLRLGVDLDGVVADFNRGWMSRYNREFGAGLTPDLIQRWDGLAEATHFDHMGAFWHWARGGDGPSIFRDLPLIEGAAAALGELAAKHNIVIITAKPRWAIHDTFAWLADNKIPTREVHIISKKYEVACDVYVEDSPHQLETLIANRPDAIVFRFVRPWNWPIGGAHDITTWPQLTALIQAATDSVA
jgi:5'(3')-deoxyribonucleotidase